MLSIIFAVLNLIIALNAQYVGTPNSTANLQAVLRTEIQLKCQYTGNDGDGQFVEWYRDGESVKKEKPGHYSFKNSPTESILTIKPFVHSDAEVQKWSVKTDKPGFQEPIACQFNQIELKSSPQGIETNRPNEKVDAAHGSIRRNEDELTVLRCLIEPRTNNTNQIQWEFGANDHTFSDLPEGITVLGNELIINQVKKIHRGYYRCILNNAKFTVLLRVKDRLAALWPFIGIVSAVLLLVIIILIFEKRQKSSKKTVVVDDEEQDQANDPLVDKTTKASDNENKKRALKA